MELEIGCRVFFYLLGLSASDAGKFPHGISDDKFSKTLRELNSLRESSLRKVL